MIRKRAPSGLKPVYRHLVREAFVAAWRNRRLWPLALFAGVLQTGGIIDVLLFSIQKIQMETQAWVVTRPIPLLGSFIGYLSSVSNISGFLDAVSSVENILIAVLIIFGFLAFSVICQGALVYALNRTHNGEQVTLYKALSIGGKHLPALAMLNLITYGLLWIVKSIVLLPTAFYFANQTTGTIFGILIGTVIFAAIFILLTAMHLLSLNAIVVDNMTLVQAINISLNFFRQQTVTILELGILLFVVGTVMLLAGLSTFLVASIPFYILINLFFLTNASGLLIFTFTVAMLTFFATMLIFGAWNFCFNYASWERLYDRFMNQTPSSRLHRWLYWLLGNKA